MKSKISILVVLGSVVVIAGLIGGFFVLKNNDKIQEQDITQLTWSTYTDEEGVYTFEYPEGWEVVVTEFGLQVKHPLDSQLEVKVSNSSGIADDLDIGKGRLTFGVDTLNVPVEEQKFIPEGLRGRTKKRLALLDIGSASVLGTGLKIDYVGLETADLIKQAVLALPSFEFQEVKEQYRDVKNFREEDLSDLFKKTSLTEKYLIQAELGLNPPTIDLTFDETGAQILEELTRRNIGLPLAIVADGQIIAAPTISEPIVEGTVRLSGVFNPGEALEIAGELKALIFSPSVFIISEIACKEERERECRGKMWSENGGEAVDVVPNVYAEIHKERDGKTYIFSVITESEGSFEMEVFDHIVSSFQFEQKDDTDM